jgi:ribonuclease D
MKRLNKKCITKEEINELPLKEYRGTVHIIDSDDKTKDAARAISKESVLGFDTETRPAFKSGASYPPSLLQLATGDGVYLFQLGRICSHRPLGDILSNKRIIKVGISISDDILKLKKVFPFRPAGFVELAKMAAGAGIENAGMRGLAALLFGFRISKQSKISRWDAHKLKRRQIAYAATDAWICREIYLALSR